MDLKRCFTTEYVKGTPGYLNSQKKYELVRTVVYFTLSLSLFLAGYLTTNTRNNLLTIVAILGCLPASKSLVGTIMFFRFHSLEKSDAESIRIYEEGLYCLHDMVFTTREKTYPVLHLTICGNTIAGYLPEGKGTEESCAGHLRTCLKADGYTDVTVKLYPELNRYLERLKQLKQLSAPSGITEGIINTLKSIAL